jgi:hypothetical protein
MISQSYPFNFGSTNQDIDSSVEIWRFFCQYPPQEPFYPLTLSSTGSENPPTAPPASSTGCPIGEYLAGETIDLTAFPAGGHHVTGWSGTQDDASTALTNQVMIPAGSHEASSHYRQDLAVCYTLTLGYTGEGEVPTASPDYSIGCSPGNYLEGETIGLTALPAGGSRVSGWTGMIDDDCSSLTNQVLMPGEDHEAAVLYKDDNEIFLPTVIKEE